MGCYSYRFLHSKIIFLERKQVFFLFGYPAFRIYEEGLRNTMWVMSLFPRASLAKLWNRELDIVQWTTAMLKVWLYPNPNAFWRLFFFATQWSVWGSSLNRTFCIVTLLFVAMHSFSLLSIVFPHIALHLIYSLSFLSFPVVALQFIAFPVVSFHCISFHCN